MKLSLIFENSNDSIDFEIVYNHDLLEFFVDNCNRNLCNQFSDCGVIDNTTSKRLNELHTALTLTNSVMIKIAGLQFSEHSNLLDYLDQGFLNKQHEQWVFSQLNEIDIDQLRFSSDKEISRFGWQLHDQYPDDIKKIKLAEAMTKLGYIFPYEEVNMTVHRLESFFSNNIEFKSQKKWQVFDNPYHSTMISNNDVVNLSFGYTFVGRQYYNKWKFFDSDLSCQDHYNYETLEYAFQLNLARPETVPFSPEFVSWCQAKNLPVITTQIPIANAVDIEKNLQHYRTILYHNSRCNNPARLEIH